MKVDLRVGNEEREVVCPPDVVWFGISSNSVGEGMNISKYLEYYSDRIKTARI